jgi:putative membrane protein
MRSPGRTALAASFAVVLIATATTPILAQAKGGGGGTAVYVPDHTFLVNAATSGLEQVRLGRLAVLKAKNAGVKSLAQKLVDDYGKANDQLRQLASSKGAKDLPSYPDRSTQAVFDSLEKLAGDDFDVAYIHRAVASQVSNVALFDREAQNGTDADLRQFAASAVAGLRDDLSTAQDLENKIAGRSSRKESH